MMRKGNARMRLQFDNLTFDPKSRQLWADGTELHLSLKAFADWCAADE
jgi:DNA-binding response OmpR family regulator